MCHYLPMFPFINWVTKSISNMIAFNVSGCTVVLVRVWKCKGESWNTQCKERIAHLLCLDNILNLQTMSGSLSVHLINEWWTKILEIAWWLVEHHTDLIGIWFLMIIIFWPRDFCFVLILNRQVSVDYNILHSLIFCLNFVLNSNSH